MSEPRLPVGFASWQRAMDAAEATERRARRAAALLDSAAIPDGMLLRDLMGVGLFDASWPARFPPELAARLQHVLDTPNG